MGRDTIGIKSPPRALCSGTRQVQLARLAARMRPKAPFLSASTASRGVRVMLIAHITIMRALAAGIGRNMVLLPRVFSHLMVRNIALFTRPHAAPFGGIRRTRRARFGAIYCIEMTECNVSRPGAGARRYPLCK